MNESPEETQATRAPQRWQDYSAAKQARIIAQGLVNLALISLAVRDLRQRPASEINGNKKIWWVAAFAPPIGPLAYFLFGRKRGVPAGGEYVIDERTGE